MALPIFPAHVLNPDPVRAGIAGRLISGGTSLSGDETVIQTDGGGRIEITYGEMDLDDPDNRRLYDIWQDYFSAGNPALIPVLALELAPVPDGASSAFVANDPYFPTAAGFSPYYVIAETVGAASLRATSIVVEVSQGDAPKHATWFGLGARAYRIQRVESLGSNQYLLSFLPPLRAAIADGTYVNFDWPCVQCRAVLGQDLIPNISLGQYGSISIAFVEDFSEVEP